MVEKGLIRPPSEGGKGWKSADELRTVTCYVSASFMESGSRGSRGSCSSYLVTLAMWREGALCYGLSEPGRFKIRAIWSLLITDSTILYSLSGSRSRVPFRLTYPKRLFGTIKQPYCMEPDNHIPFSLVNRLNRAIEEV